MDILTQENKPVHFLGIGEVEDIFLSIKKGIDSFDCVTPTRLARMGHVFLKKAGLKNKFRYDITKAEYSHDKSTIDKTCNCYTCCNYTKSYLNHLFRNKELLAYRLATIHNLSFFGNLMNAIRESIINGKYQKLMDEWLNIY
jgi:tRNA-guanine family transglycosylase